MSIATWGKEFIWLYSVHFEAIISYFHLVLSLLRCWKRHLISSFPAIDEIRDFFDFFFSCFRLLLYSPFPLANNFPIMARVNFAVLLALPFFFFFFWVGINPDQIRNFIKIVIEWTNCMKWMGLIILWGDLLALEKEWGIWWESSDPDIKSESKGS